jgi:hypothetical protein
LRKSGKGLRNLQNRGYARGVVDCAVVNLIALQMRVAAEVIPVGAVDDVFIVPLRITSFKPANNVVGLEMLNLVSERKIRLYP